MVFVVDSTGDSVDSNDGVTTLREAIIAANAHAGADIIEFKITSAGPHSIQLDSALPTITDSVMIDGWSQQGFAGSPVIELDGSNTSGANGLYITASNTTVRGLVINRFDEFGVILDGGDSNVVEGNYIGTNITGVVAFSNGKPASGFETEHLQTGLVPMATE